MLRLSSQPRKSDGETPPPTTPHATGAMECLLGPCAGPGHGGIERYAAEVTLHSVEVRVASRRVAVICAFGSVFHSPRAFSHPSPRRGTRPRRSHRPHLTRVPLLAQGLERDVGGFLDGEDAVFVRIRWSGSSRASSSSSSYFRRVPIDDTSRARAPRDAFASLDSLDFHETFVHTRCDMIRAGDARERSGATVAVADLARLDDLAHLDDPARVDEGNPRFLPWEVRLSVRALSNDAKPGAAGRELCEGVLDLARFARRHPDAAAAPAIVRLTDGARASLDVRVRPSSGSFRSAASSDAYARDVIETSATENTLTCTTTATSILPILPPPSTPPREGETARARLKMFSTSSSRRADSASALASSPRKHARGLSWSAQWSAVASPRTRRKIARDARDVDVVLDDEILLTPPPAGARFPPAEREDEDEIAKAESREREGDADADADADADSDESPKSAASSFSSRSDSSSSAASSGGRGHARSSSWSSAASLWMGASHARSSSWSSAASSWMGASKWMLARRDRKDRRAADKAARREEKTRRREASEKLRERCRREEGELERVLAESEALARERLPLRLRGAAEDTAACVLVTPPTRTDTTRTRTVAVGLNGDERDLAREMDAAAPSAADAEEGEWVSVELRAAAAADETSPSRRVRATAFFATTDQRGAGGEGSCTLCCVALAEWLEANPGRSPAEAMPLDAIAGAAEALSTSIDTVVDALETTPAPRFVMDGIIAGAAREWRALCRDEALVSRFPDRHLDLDTAVRFHTPFSAEAEAIAATVVRHGGGEGERATTSARASAYASFRIPASIRLRPGDSFGRFSRPPGVSRGDSPTIDALADAAPPIRAIVDELAAMAPATFVVSWNDHFFVLRFARESRVGPDGDDELAAYAYDSLGERLCEGCKRAYVLRFDAESLEGDENGTAAAVAAYLGDVLPSRPLRHLADDVAALARGDPRATEPDPETLMRRLQIEFHRVEGAGEGGTKT